MSDGPLEDFAEPMPESVPMSAADRAEQRMLDRMLNQTCSPETPMDEEPTNVAKMTQWAVCGSDEYQGFRAPATGCLPEYIGQRLETET